MHQNSVQCAGAGSTVGSTAREAGGGKSTGGASEASNVNVTPLARRTRIFTANPPFPREWSNVATTTLGARLLLENRCSTASQNGLCDICSIAISCVHHIPFCSQHKIYFLHSSHFALRGADYFACVQTASHTHTHVHLDIYTFGRWCIKEAHLCPRPVPQCRQLDGML